MKELYISSGAVSATGRVVSPKSGGFNYMTPDEIREYVKNALAARFLGETVSEQAKSAVRSFVVEKLQYLLTEGHLGSYGAVSVSVSEGVCTVSFEFSLPSRPASVAVNAELDIKEGA